jgi:hypothetical protein
LHEATKYVTSNLDFGCTLIPCLFRLQVLFCNPGCIVESTYVRLWSSAKKWLFLQNQFFSLRKTTIILFYCQICHFFIIFFRRKYLHFSAKISTFFGENIYIFRRKYLHFSAKISTLLSKAPFFIRFFRRKYITNKHLRSRILTK